METIRFEFYECEHSNDIQNYIGDIVACGGNIIEWRVDADSEIGVVRFKVRHKETFMNKFRETEAFEFLN